MKFEGYIYKVTNIQNNKIYIGATQRSLDERKRDHIYRSKNNKGHLFHSEISTYGEENFIWEEIDTASNSNSLAEKEREYIIKYNTKEAGYNLDIGGGLFKKIFQYDGETGQLLNCYLGLDNAANAVNVHFTTISKACLGELKTCAGYYWSYSLSSNFKREADQRKKQVFQFSIVGEFITQFCSVAEAARKTGVNASSIAKCSRGEYALAGDYRWEYSS